MPNVAFKTTKTARRGFTLTETVIALAILGLLAALLFPVLGRARESSRQNHCAGNLQNIYVATRQYREDFQGYPPNLETLLPAGSIMVVTSGGEEPLAPAHRNMPLDDPLTRMGATGLNDFDFERLQTTTVTPATTANPNAYLKSMNEALCPSDALQLNAFSSSYGAKIGSVWNFYGYDRLGFSSETFPEAAHLVDPTQPYDARRNPAKSSLANRFAPPRTIVTHCIFHRAATSNLQNPYALGTSNENGLGKSAGDIILRLDGSAKFFNVASFSGTQTDGSDSVWQLQNF